MTTRPADADATRDGGPLARHDLRAFLTSSTTVLFGLVGSSEVVTSASPALASWLGGNEPAVLEGALTPTSLVRFRRLATRVRLQGRAIRSILRFGGGLRAGSGQADGYRCLIAPGPGDAVWLVGEPFKAVDPATVVTVRRLRATRRRAVGLAMTDHLTGLANRRQGERWLTALCREAERRGAPLSGLLVDLDQFKAVNDEHGHAAGDLVLRTAADAMAGAVRSGDRLARLGGDEFLVLLPATDRAGALAVAGRLRAALTVAASVGIAVRRPGEAPARFLERADAALLRAKAAGRDRVEVDP